MGQEARKLSKTISKQVALDYVLYLPPEYGEDAGKKWPLILFLHGAGERGDNVEAVKVHGPPKMAAAGHDFEFIIVSPQCPENTWWPTHFDALIALLDDLAAEHAVDTDRVYVTGLSMGGFGTWALAAAYPDRFAAIAPICGGGLWMFGFPDRAEEIKHIPVWAFHGLQDEVVPYEPVVDIIKHMEEAGGDAALTVYPAAGHDSWTKTYNNPLLYKWFLLHKRKDS